MGDLVQREHPKNLGGIGVGSGEQKTCNISISETVQDVIVISLSTVEYTSVSRVYSTVDSDITNLIHGPCRLSGASSGC